MTAGSDGRICHYLWQPSFAHEDTQSSLKTPQQTNNNGNSQKGAQSSFNKLQQTKASSHGHTKPQPQEAAKHGGSTVGANCETNSKPSTGESNNSCARSSGAEEKGCKGASSSLSMRLVCVSEERLPNITTVQDVVQIAGSREQLACGFQVLPIGLLSFVCFKRFVL